MSNDQKALIGWLRCLLDQTTPRIDLRSQRRLLRQGETRVELDGDLRGDLSQWLAKIEFRPRPDCRSILEMTAPGFGTIVGRELFRNLYL